MHLYPWWFNYTFDNAVRRLFHRPVSMLAPHVREGMTTLDIGCGMGFFSLGMAKLVGESGRVIAVDVRPRVLDVLMRRAERQGVADRIRAHRCTPNSLGVEETVDFVLAFWMVHEVPDKAVVARQVRACLRPGGRCLLAEPKLHVSRPRFQEIVSVFEDAGLRPVGMPAVRLSMAALFEAGAQDEVEGEGRLVQEYYTPRGMAPHMFRCVPVGGSGVFGR